MGLPLVGDTEYRRNRAQCDRKVLEHLNRPLVVSKIFFYIFIRKLGKTFTHFDDAIFFKWVGEPTHHPGPFLHKLRFVFPNLRGDPVSVCLPLESRCIRSDPFGFLGV